MYCPQYKSSNKKKSRLLNAGRRECAIVLLCKIGKALSHVLVSSLHKTVEGEQNYEVGDQSEFGTYH